MMLHNITALNFCNPAISFTEALSVMLLNIDVNSGGLAVKKLEIRCLSITAMGFVDKHSHCTQKKYRFISETFRQTSHLSDISTD